MNESTRRIATLTSTAATLALLAACGSSLSGTYGEKGGVTFEFHSNGKVELDVLGPVQEATYVVEDGKVKISSPSQGTMVLKIDPQGCLDGGAMMGKLCKR
ncbi:MAG: hypothetical protein ABI218_12715 [Caldimonas sp.]